MAYHPLDQPFLHTLRIDWLSNVFPMGIVLILITLLLKLITYPMVKKSYMSSAKMRVLETKTRSCYSSV